MKNYDNRLHYTGNDHMNHLTMENVRKMIHDFIKKYEIEKLMPCQ